MGASVITLIKESYKRDGIGQMIPDEPERREIFVTAESVSRAEWFAAQNAGLSCSFVFSMPSVNYGGEKLAEVDGKKYLVYRAYDRGETTELYLGQRGGLNG